MRQQKHDIGSVARHMRDLSERQSELFFLIVTFLLELPTAGIEPLIDADVAEAAAALAATFETAARGVIYEHRATSLPAERLAIALRSRCSWSWNGRRIGLSARRCRRLAARRRSGARRDHGRRRQSSRVPRSDWPRDGGAEPGRRDPDDPGSKTDDGPRIIIP